VSVKFEDVIEDITRCGRKITSDNYQTCGEYPIVDQGQRFIAGYLSESQGLLEDVPVIIFGDHTRVLKYVDFPFFLGADGVKVLKVKNNNFLVKYVYYNLCAKQIPDTGYNRHFKWLKQVNLKESSFQDQKIIVESLDKINALIEKRKQQLEKLDLLVKSKFTEMFGKIGEDEKRWGLKTLGECCKINPPKSNDTRLKDGLEVSFVPMSAVSENGGIDCSERKFYEQVQKGFTYFAEDDVLFAKITPCMENGKGAIARSLKNGMGFGSTEFHVLRPVKGVSNAEWLYEVTAFKKFRHDAAKKMTGSAGQRRVPSAFLVSYKISLPPIELQNEFARFVEQIDRLKLKIKRSLEQLETLKKALMQKYFG